MPIANSQSPMRQHFCSILDWWSNKTKMSPWTLLFQWLIKKENWKLWLVAKEMRRFYALQRDYWVHSCTSTSWEIKRIKSEQKPGPLSSALPLIACLEYCECLSLIWRGEGQFFSSAPLPLYVIRPTEDCFDLSSTIWPVLTAAPERSDLIGCTQRLQHSV